jgi:N-acyl homoserine lactone hydrolase
MTSDLVNGCMFCGYRYHPEAGDPDHGIPPGTRFEDLPPDWHCPRCGAARDEFLPVPRPP